MPFIVFFLFVHVEVDCGVPPPVPYSVMQWNNVSTMGSQVVYKCISGYHNVGEGGSSICTASGEWADASFLCQGDTGINRNNPTQ